MLLSIHPCNGLRLIDNSYHAAAHALDTQHKKGGELIFLYALRHNPQTSVAFQPFDSKKDEHNFALDQQRTHGDLDRCTASQLDENGAHARELFAGTLTLQHNKGGEELCVAQRQTPSVPYIPRAPSFMLHVHDDGAEVNSPECADSKAPAELQNVLPKKMADYNVDYEVYFPPEGICTAQSKCSLTIYLAGGATMHNLEKVLNNDQPTLAYYLRYPRCLEQLRTVLAIPALPVGKAGEPDP